MPINDTIIKLEDPTTFTCPFCLGTFTISPEVPIGMHSMPPCKMFLETELIDFLEQARKAGAAIVPDRL